MEPIYIIKIGGHIIDDEHKLISFLEEFAGVPGKKVLVHGGGKLATELALKMGVEQTMVDGRRITDADTLKIVTMVYAGQINKQIVAKLQSIGCHALGLSGADGNLILAHQRKKGLVDYGFAGDIDLVNTSLLKLLLDQEITLVIAPITHNGEGQLLNTNADTIAQELARALTSFYDVFLVYSFEKNGVLLDINDHTSVIPKLGPAYYKQLKDDQKIFAGMIPKIDNAFAALQSGVKQVIVGKAEELSRLIAHQSGTNITYD